jgi:6,7-dimethyl-8-ribityllumazine synthase
VSGAGAASLAPLDPHEVAGLRVAVVAASWHQQVMDGLVAGALSTLTGCGSSRGLSGCRGRSSSPWSPPRWPRPPTPWWLSGVVIRGGTPHFDYVCRAATDGLVRAGLDSGVAVGFGC